MKPHEIVFDEERFPAVDVAGTKRRFSGVGMSFFVLLMITVALQIGGSFLTAWLAPPLMHTAWYLWLVSFFPLYGVGIPVCLLLLRRYPAAAPQPHRISAGRLAVCVLMSLSLLYIGSMVGAFFIRIIQLVTGVAAENPVEAFAFGTSLWLRLLVMVVLAPVLEELVFRKALLDRLREYGEWPAMLLSALFFGLFHGNFSQFFYAFGLGLFFAFLYLRTGHVRYPIGLHMLINFLGSVLSPWLLENLETGGLSPDLSLAAFISPAWIFFLLYGAVLVSCSLAGFILLIVQHRAFVLKPAAKQLPQIGWKKIVFGNVGVLLMLSGCAVLFITSFLPF